MAKVPLSLSVEGSDSRQINEPSMSYFQKRKKCAYALGVSSLTVSQDARNFSKRPHRPMPQVINTNILHKTMCKSPGCSNHCGTMSEYSTHLQQKVALGLFLPPTHCFSCLTHRGSSRLWSPVKTVNTVTATSPPGGLADLLHSLLAALDSRLAALEAQAVRSEARGVRSEAWVTQIAHTIRQQAYSV